eukprot:ctg_5607.g841
MSTSALPLAPGDSGSGHGSGAASGSSGSAAVCLATSPGMTVAVAARGDNALHELPLSSTP